MNQLRVGVICEGPTDFHAISHFMGASLRQSDIEAVFIDIQPDMGRTLPDAGWGNVELWLRNNPPKARVSNYFEGGLFQGNLSAKACDLLLIQMDSDILDDENFRNHMQNGYGHAVPSASDPMDRGRHIVDILQLWSEIKELTAADIGRHVFAPAVESTEAWCVAAFDSAYTSPEKLKGEALTKAFMAALDQSESRPVQCYANIDKDVKRRERFCKKHAAGHQRIRNGCPHFDSVVTRIQALKSGA